MNGEVRVEDNVKVEIEIHRWNHTTSTYEPYIPPEGMEVYLEMNLLDDTYVRV